MTTGDKIAKLRRDNNYTQEQLAGIFGVSRQSISKWESGVAYPEVEKLIRMSEFFNCTLDYLLKDGVTEPSSTYPSSGGAAENAVCDNFPLSNGWYIRERTSERRLFGLPLWQTGKNAHAVFAVGVRARGLVSVGMLSMGLISLGMLSLGLVSIGLVAIGLLSCGCVSIGAVSVGTVAIGVVSIGTVVCGDFAYGAVAAGRYFAAGDRSDAMIAIGRHEANGTLFSRLGPMSAADRAKVRYLLDTVVPEHLKWAKELVKLFL